MSINERQIKAVNGKIPAYAGIDRWEEVADIICDNAYFDWKKLAEVLGVDPGEISKLQKSKLPLQEKCWKALNAWYRGTHQKLWPYTLKEALKKCRHLRVADIMERLTSSTESIDKLLHMLEYREERMRQALYFLTECLCHQWRMLALKLGLSKEDIAEIESRFSGHQREKCMHALYKWRSMIPLQEYKVGNLIMAVKACNFHGTAAALAPYAESSFVPPPHRKKRRGEAIIHIDIRHIELERPDSHVHTILPKNVLRDYVLNKIFLRLLDGLDDQCPAETHSLVSYLQSINKSDITYISRSNFVIIVDCGSPEQLQDMFELSRTGELEEKFTECLISEELLRELNVHKIELQTLMVERELVTPAPSEASTSRNDITRS